MRIKNKLAFTTLTLYLFLYATGANAQNSDTIKVRKGDNQQPAPSVLKARTLQTETVYSTYDEAPIPPGGNDGYKEYLTKNINYPNSAIKANASGTVYVSIVIEKDGRLTDVHLEKDNVHYGCGEEAVRVIKNMPPWTPGKMNGVPVKVKYVIPVMFRLK